MSQWTVQRRKSATLLFMGGATLAFLVYVYHVVRGMLMPRLQALTDQQLLDPASAYAQVETLARDAVLDVLFWGVVATIAVHAATALWVWLDGRSRGRESLAWVLLCLPLGAFAQAGWLIVRPRGRLGVCPACGQECLETLPACPFCGLPHEHSQVSGPTPESPGRPLRAH